MPPDDRLVPFDGSGSDPILDALAEDLAEAGRRSRARAARAQTPRRAFAAELRARLMADLPVAISPAALSVAPSRTAVEGPMASTPHRVSPRITARPPALLPAPRWPILAIAAVVFLAIIGLGPARLMREPAVARAGDVVAATLTRAGTTTELTPATVLHAGDEVATGDQGSAILELGTSMVRLDGARPSAWSA